ncbi:ABC transporter permease [Polymorphospora rubra]|uniref:ABC transporter permease n=1 Tax=Polymorphospora rubra TaxID=338584 RepID=UPI00340B3FCE
MTTQLEIAMHRPGARAWLTLIRAETKMVVRDTAGLLVPIGLPLLILVMNGLGTSTQELPGLDGLTAFDVYVIPIVIAIVVATIGVVNMPSFLAYYRRGGVLRRLAVTPANPAMVLAAQVVTSIAQTTVGIVLALTVALLAFDAHPPRNPGMALGVVVLAALAMYAIGLLIAAIAPTGNAAVAIGLVLFFGMGATGGMFGPVVNLPDVVARVGEVLPFGAVTAAVGDAWAGQTPEPLHLISLVAAIVISGLGAARFFRWE